MAIDIENIIPGAFWLSFSSDDISTKGNLGLEKGESYSLAKTVALHLSLLEDIDATYSYGVWMHLRDAERVRAYIREGFSVPDALFTKEFANIEDKTFKKLVGFSRRSVLNRWSRGKLLSPTESDRVFRLQEVICAALALHEGNIEGMRRWLHTPLQVLGQETPLDYSDTTPGAKFVIDLATRLEHGVYS